MIRIHVASANSSIAKTRNRPASGAGAGTLMVPARIRDRAMADALLATADVVCLSSREEGMGSVLLDALAFGRPIAATRAGGIPEVVGDCGLLVPVEDPNALGEAIARLIQDSALAARFRAGSRERAAEFSVERMADRTIVVYERVLANGR